MLSLFQKYTSNNNNHLSINIMYTKTKLQNFQKCKQKMHMSKTQHQKLKTYPNYKRERDYFAILVKI